VFLAYLYYETSTLREREKETRISSDSETRNWEIDQRHPVRLFADFSGIPPLSLSQDSILSFCLSRVSFFAITYPVLRLFSVSSSPRPFSSRGIKHSPSAPESCLQIRHRFLTFFVHPKDKHPRTLSATFTLTEASSERPLFLVLACLFRRQRSP